MSAQPFGGIDSKVVNVELVAANECLAICGPTAQQQPPFSWNNWTDSSWPHFGMPNTFDFAWEYMQPLGA
jgi:hypothetical protein